jgi:GNAT superfamily N-acetyltransferase
MINIQTFTQKEIAAYLDDLAQLRISVFREYPYLYDGSLGYEKEYLQTFVNAENGIVVAAFDDDKVVGMSTGLPLAQEPAAVIGQWETEDLASIFYFSESVLDRNYRGQGIGVQFFHAREDWARKLGFTQAVFCGVVRPDDHPLKPAGYLPLDQFWQKRGFAKKEGYFAEMSWLDRGDAEETTKALQYWWKAL